MAGLQQQIESLFSFQVCIHTLVDSSMENDLHARVQTLARLRRGRIGVSDRWDDSGGIARDDYLIATELAVQKFRGCTMIARSRSTDRN